MHDWKLPAGVTPVAAAVVALAALLAIILLARAVGRLAKAAAMPAPVPESGGHGKLVLGAAAAAGALLLWSRHETAGPAAFAGAGTRTSTPSPAPSLSPSPSPSPSVTQSAVPHVTSAAHHFLLTGSDIVALYVIAAIVAIVLVGQALRRSS